ELVPAGVNRRDTLGDLADALHAPDRGAAVLLDDQSHVLAHVLGHLRRSSPRSIFPRADVAERRISRRLPSRTSMSISRLQTAAASASLRCHSTAVTPLGVR